ncbi:MAG TPA: hypothetical protein VFB80_16135 [Pirellulaceae bacterium]|nr:hypothetical protein [Pirellulaceae bacterium]
MPRGRIRRQPSGRNLELYHELVCEGRSRHEVAARFRLSRPRVTQLRGQVAEWVAAMLPPGFAATGDPGRRFHQAISVRRLQLQKACGEFLDEFGGGRGAQGYQHLLAARKRGVLPRTSRLPSRELVQSAVRMARELDDLARVASRGPSAGPQVPAEAG